MHRFERTCALARQSGQALFIARDDPAGPARIAPTTPSRHGIGRLGIVKANAPLVTNEVRPQSVRFLFSSCSP